MCGIACIFGDISGHEKLEASILHRGKESGKFIDKDVAIYHRLLPLTGHQPQPMINDRWVMVFNGEVYNWKDFKGVKSDTELVWKVLTTLDSSEWAKYLNQFNGEWAIILYDRVERGYYVITDRYGIRPLFTYSDSKRTIIASEIQSILKLIKPVEEEVSVDECKNFRVQVGNHTCFKGVFRCEPGTINNDKWYELKPRDIDFEQTLEDAIRIRTRKYSAVLLSSGIDSYLIAQYGSRYGLKKAYTLEGSEVKEAKRIAKKFGLKHEVVPIHYDKKEMVKCLEQPFYSFPPNWILAQAIEEDVVLSGLGADELLGGYYYYKKPYSAQTYKKERQLTRFGDIRFISKYRGLQAMKDLDLNYSLVNHHLYRTDKMYMSNTIEARVPYLDHRIVEYLFFSGLDNKDILTNLAIDFKPSKKKGLSLSRENNFEEIYNLWKELFF